jgi:uncharacterized cupredoxin-like copper-binding protein
MNRRSLRTAAFGISTLLFATGGLVLSGLTPGPALAHGTFAAGDPGDPKKPTSRTIEIVAREADGRMSYTPDKIEVKRGEQIRFVIKNEGELAHEFLLDSFEGNAKHKIQMEKNPTMEHDEPNGTRLETKKAGEILWVFDKVGTFEFACLIPGHYEAGMKGVVTVVDAKSTSKKK